jgi:hypothetical protein
MVPEPLQFSPTGCWMKFRNSIPGKYRDFSLIMKPISALGLAGLCPSYTIWRRGSFFGGKVVGA